MTRLAIERFIREDGETIAYLKRGGKSPGVVWLGGFHSDMNGTKAQALDAWAESRGRAYLRFDYFGHGASSGAFRDGTITRWRDDALAVLDKLCDGPQVLVGSSMGAWIALLVARARPEKVAALLLLAPAADFTEALIWARMTPDIRREVMERGEWQRPSAYGDGPYPITRALIEDGRRHLLLDAPIELDCSGSHPAGHEGSRRALAARAEARRETLRQSRADPDQERRSPPVDARGYRPHRAHA